MFSDTFLSITASFKKNVVHKSLLTFQNSINYKYGNTLTSSKSAGTLNIPSVFVPCSRNTSSERVVWTQGNRRCGYLWKINNLSNVLILWIFICHIYSAASFVGHNTFSKNMLSFKDVFQFLSHFLLLLLGFPESVLLVYPCEYSVR